MDAPLVNPRSVEPTSEPTVDSTLLDGYAASSMIGCWRCGKAVLATALRCPFCEAPLATDAETELADASSWKSDARSLVRLLVFFAVMLGISVLMGLIGHVRAALAPHRPPTSGQTLATILFFEGIDTALVLVAWAWCGMRYREPRRPLWNRAAAWTLALPMLAAVLAINVAYHHLLQREFGVAHNPVALVNKGLWAGWIFAICIQPAIIEELFFRYLMFGALRSVMGGNAVVWVTAVMFAAAHVGVPLSLPVLFVLGALLGYARLTSGSIYLPIFLHFLHNAVVTALNVAHF